MCFAGVCRVDRSLVSDRFRHSHHFASFSSPGAVGCSLDNIRGFRTAEVRTVQEEGTLVRSTNAGRKGRASECKRNAPHAAGGFSGPQQVLKQAGQTGRDTPTPLGHGSLACFSPRSFLYLTTAEAVSHTFRSCAVDLRLQSGLQSIGRFYVRRSNCPSVASYLP